MLSVFMSQLRQACGSKSAACLFGTVIKTTGPNMFVSNGSRALETGTKNATNSSAAGFCGNCCIVSLWPRQ